MTTHARRPHAALEKEPRYRKGQKIERLLQIAPERAGLRLLEAGAGSGWISHYFTRSMLGRYQVDAVDVVDNRQVSEGYSFTLVDGTQLPFPDGTFDIVISNHVIEHVGSDEEQAQHLAELLRVMKSGGVGYLAVPNRWMLFEPHYHLALLSWWPEAWRSAWLRLWRKGQEYDCRPLACSDLESRLQYAGFSYTQLHGQALRATFEIESPDRLLWKWCLRHVPTRIWIILRRIFPTLIYRLEKTSFGDGEQESCGPV
ncbi:class I SAM-dependent methyltransferase [Luteimonas sp. MJ246]|uniref:class I SAM-dependent methyltransferase n=1 Tax=Luteimonas sp. MJ174 TaxID=3129237 RepID=UPI0031BB35FE